MKNWNGGFCFSQDKTSLLQCEVIVTGSLSFQRHVCQIVFQNPSFFIWISVTPWIETALSDFHKPLKLISIWCRLGLQTFYVLKKSFRKRFHGLPSYRVRWSLLMFSISYSPKVSRFHHLICHNKPETAYEANFVPKFDWTMRVHFSRTSLCIVFYWKRRISWNTFVKARSTFSICSIYSYHLNYYSTFIFGIELKTMYIIGEYLFKYFYFSSLHKIV